MIFGAFECVNANRLSESKPLVFSKKIFCPALLPGLKLPVKGFSVQTSTGAVPAPPVPPPEVPPPEAPLPDADADILRSVAIGKMFGAEEFDRSCLGIQTMGKKATLSL